jgi:chorismate-pyruvate lyase
MITDQLHLPFTTPTQLGTLTHPLDAFYAETGATLPLIQRVEASAIPEPWRRLLVHTDDMTPTLEAFHQGNIHIRVLGRRRQDNEYFREVVLHLDETKQPVEFGANRILLDRFPEAAQRLILAEHEPLGHILRDFRVRHTCEPNAFLRLSADALISQALGLNGGRPILYGRHNRLFDPEGQLLSEVVEILPPPPATAP